MVNTCDDEEDFKVLEKFTLSIEYVLSSLLHRQNGKYMRKVQVKSYQSLPSMPLLCRTIETGCKFLQHKKNANIHHLLMIEHLPMIESPTCHTLLFTFLTLHTSNY